MSDIVKFDSLSYTDIRDDIENFMSIMGEIDTSDFNQLAVMRRLTEALAGIYNQTRIKIDNVRKESIMDSAIRPESVRYLALSQMSYNPKRRIAPQHPLGHFIKFKTPGGLDINPKAILGNIKVDDISYPISLLDGYIPNEDGTHFVGQLCIGSWKHREMILANFPGHLSPFFNFRVEEERDAIDDSGTIGLTVYRSEGIEGRADDENTIAINAKVIDNLYDLSLYSDEEKENLVLVKNSYFGGLDINFGDGFVYGNLLYHDSPYKFIVTYLHTPGFLPNLNFVPDNITWDNDFVTEEEELFDINVDEVEWKEVRTPVEIDEDERYFGDWPRYSIDFANGIDAEPVSQIKTLSPYISMSNQRIMTNEDFIARVQRIPNIKSAFSMPVHIEPGDIDSVSPLVPTATFKLSGLTIRNVFAFDNEGKYAYNSVVLYKFKRKKTDPKPTEALFRLIDPIRWNGGEYEDLVNENGQKKFVEEKNSDRKRPGVNNPYASLAWKEITVEEVDEFQALSQTEWDLNFHKQYNFDNLLGFMRVRIIPPIQISEEKQDQEAVFRLTIQLNPYRRGDRSTGEVNTEARDIIMSYCWTLGAFLDVGEIISRINNIPEVSKVYLQNPVSNKQYAFNQYIKPTIKIKFISSTGATERIGTLGK